MSDNGWRPIAEAPKDGTLVDLWVEYIEPGRATDYQWLENGWYSRGHSRFLMEATHWRLPPSPPPGAGSACLNKPTRSREAAALDVARRALSRIAAGCTLLSTAIGISLKAIDDIETILEGDGE
jgi:hypothetical protein